MNRSLHLPLALAAVLALAQMTWAQQTKMTQGRLNVGQNEALHYVKMAKGQVYEIELVSKDFDTYLRLRDAKGKEVAKDDDGGEGLTALLYYSPAQAGRFTIVATSFQGNGTGNYTLIIRHSKGEVKQGKLSAASPRLNGKPYQPYKSRFVAGKTYQIDLVSNDVDTYLYLRKGGKVVASDDDGGSDLNSRITFTPDATGNYEVLASRFGNQASGSFTLIVREVKK